jgi:hypothetical protein
MTITRELNVPTFATPPSGSATNVERTRARKLYLGHSAGDVTGLYEHRELIAWLDEDGERLRSYARVALDALGALKVVSVA